MKKWLTYISVGLVAAALPALMLFFSPWATAQDERGECQKRCTDQYQECRRAANANQATCKQTFDACRDACRAGNTNANGNTNQPGVRRGPLVGTPRGPVNKNANTSPTP